MITIFKKLAAFFDKKDRKTLLILMACVIVMGLVEMVSVATILPFLAVVAKPEVIEMNPYLNQVYQFFGFTQSKYFILFLGGVVFAALILGNSFSAFTSWFMMRFSYNQGSKISSRLLYNYIKQPYAFFLNRNSGELQKNILAEVDRMIIGIVINTSLTISKCVVALCILGLLLVVNFWLACTIFFVIGGAYFAVYGLIRKKLSAAGKNSSLINADRYQTITEVFGAIKELKVLNREDTFQFAFEKLVKAYARYEALSQLTPLITRYIIEAIAFGGMLLIAIYLIWTKESLNGFLPLLGLYALAGYRLLPAIQQLFSGMTLGRYHAAAVDILYPDYLLKSTSYPKDDALITLNKELILRNISYSYPNTKKLTLDNISITVNRCTTVGFVGSSGAGKTTLADIILGLLETTKGQLIVDGQLLTADRLPGWQRNIGYVPQSIYLTDQSVKRNIALGIPEEEIDIAKVKSAAILANLHEFIMSELPQNYDTYIGEGGIRLSGGQRQRIGIARALYHDPQLLIFDEATSALDNNTEQVIIEALNQLAHQKTIIIIAHRLQTVKNCDVIYCFSKGRIESKGTYKELSNNNKEFQKLANLSLSHNHE